MADDVLVVCLWKVGFEALEDPNIEWLLDMGSVGRKTQKMDIILMD